MRAGWDHEEKFGGRNMDERIIALLLPLLHSAIHGTQLTQKEKDEFSPEMLQDLLKIAAKHDVAHLLVLGLKQNGLISDKEPEKYLFKAVYRYERLRYELEMICKLLEEMQIPFLPLKGSVIRDYYPEPWMRTSGDLDILVPKEHCEKIMAVLVEQYGYRYWGGTAHDFSLLSPRKVHVELHYLLVEEGLVHEACEVLADVWNGALKKEGYGFQYEMTDEMFYFYHIAHMAKHFQEGGCGIRSFMDLWILDHIPERDQARRDELLKRGGLLKFANMVRKLSRVWFADERHDPVSEKMENYILRGGVYGSKQNRVAVQQQKKGGKLEYALSRIVVPYEEIKYDYPILQKHPWLTPVAQVQRWCTVVSRGRLGLAAKELRYNSRMGEDEAAATQRFLDDIGL